MSLSLTVSSSWLEQLAWEHANLVTVHKQLLQVTLCIGSICQHIHEINLYLDLLVFDQDQKGLSHVYLSTSIALA